MRIHPLKTMDVCAKCHGHTSNSYRYISLWINRPMVFAIPVFLYIFCIIISLLKTLKVNFDKMTDTMESLPQVPACG